MYTYLLECNEEKEEISKQFFFLLENIFLESIPNIKEKKTKFEIAKIVN